MLNLLYNSPVKENIYKKQQEAGDPKHDETYESH